MSTTARFVLATVMAAAVGGPSPAKDLKLNEKPAGPGEWGFRPAEGQSSETNPPAFSWRPQSGAAAYELQYSRDKSFQTVAYQADGVAYNVYCPPKVFPAGAGFWRFRYRDGKGNVSDWSQVRSFSIATDAVQFPMPTREEILARIPRQHPRLFVRPEDLPRLRQLAQGELKSAYADLVKKCEKLRKNPPPSAEPPTYPPDVEHKSDEWMKIWWGNRQYTIAVLDGAATLAFTRLLGGNEAYGQLARKLLLETAKWDPKGSTGYRYNDEAGMPYAYYFSRTYTFVNDLLTEEEKALSRKVMAVRGEEMYRHLCPRHFWQPYSSHSNRAWHFLGEAGIAFLDEIPEAREWIGFAMNVFANVYPVWSDADGGWHEGISYWQSYINRFTWWADVMRAAVGVDAYRKPYFSKIGYYPLYLQPPGTKGGGFGDLCTTRTSASTRPLVTDLAAQARNPYWQWYVEANGGPVRDDGYVGFVRGSLPRVEAKAPSDLPSSRCFRGIGQAVLNSNLLDAKDNVEVVFKSSPFGSQSHGYDAQNAFLLYAFGERLLVSTGQRDCYGSKHHKEWMWETKSVNSVTVDGRGQTPHSAAAVGEILAFHTSKALDYVSGEAAGAYAGQLKRFTRSILFVKPELIVLYDRLEAPKPSTYEWRLHSPTEMKVAGQADIRVVSGRAACDVSFLAPAGLELSLTDKFDTPPRPRIKLTEWHLTARTTQPAERAEFITVIRPRPADRKPSSGDKLHKLPGGYALEAPLTDGRAVILLRAGDQGRVAFGKLSAQADVAAFRMDAAGRTVARLTAEGRNVAAE